MKKPVFILSVLLIYSNVFSVFAQETTLHEYVDLGLSVKWATMNVGATKPEDYGDYYAWGEIDLYYEDGYAQEELLTHWKGDKICYNWSTYKWCNGSDRNLTKYCIDNRFGIADNKTILDPEDDIAHVKWGGSWRVPTKAEQDELRDKCTWTWTTLNDINGYLITSNMEGYTDRSIFLPAAGQRSIILYSAGERGCYWSSSVSTDLGYTANAYYLGFSMDYIGWHLAERYHGHSIRPVCP